MLHVLCLTVKAATKSTFSPGALYMARFFNSYQSRNSVKGSIRLGAGGLPMQTCSFKQRIWSTNHEPKTCYAKIWGRELYNTKSFFHNLQTNKPKNVTYSYHLILMISHSLCWLTMRQRKEGFLLIPQLPVWPLSLSPLYFHPSGRLKAWLRRLCFA